MPPSAKRRRLDAWADHFPEIVGGVGAARAAAPLLTDLELAHRARLAAHIAERTGVHPTTVHREIAAARLCDTAHTHHGIRTRRQQTTHAFT